MRNHGVGADQNYNNMAGQESAQSTRHFIPSWKALALDY